MGGVVESAVFGWATTWCSSQGLKP